MTPTAFRTLRQSLGLSQRQLAIKLDVDRSYINHMERREQDIPPKLARDLLELAGIETCQLCGQPLPEEQAN